MATKYNGLERNEDGMPRGYILLLCLSDHGRWAS